MTVLLSFLSAIFAANIILSYGFVSTNVVDASTNVKKSFFLGLVVAALSFVAALVSFGLGLALDKANLGSLLLVLQVLVVLGLVYIIKLVKDKKFSECSLITEDFVFELLNIAIVGVSLVVVTSGLSFVNTIGFALGSGIGYTLVLSMFAAIKGRFDNYDVPRAIKGLPLALLTLGLMAMAFLGFAGIF